MSPVNGKYQTGGHLTPRAESAYNDGSWRVVEQQIGYWTDFCLEDMERRMGECRCNWIGTGRRLGMGTLFFLLVSSATVAPARADGKVGLLDFQPVLTTLRGLEGGQLQGDVRVRTQDIERLERELKPIKERLARERKNLSPEERERYEREITQRSKVIQDLYGETVREGMLKIRLRPVEAVRADLERFIQRYGKEGGFALILDKNDRRVLYRGAAAAEGEGEGAEEIELTRTFLELLPQELAAGRLGPRSGSGQ